MNGLRARVATGAYRLVDAGQLGLKTTVAEPLFEALGRMAPAGVLASTHEPHAHRGGSFVDDAPAWQRTLFLAKLLFGWGSQRPARSAPPDAVRSGVPHGTEIIFLGDCLYVDELGPDTLGPALAARLRRADALVVNLEGTIGTQGNALHPVQTWRGFRQLAGWSVTGDPALWSSRFREQQLASFVAGLPPVVFSLANNHVMDDGEPGLRRTLAALDRIGARALGIVTPGRDGGLLLDIGDRRVGLVAVSFGHNHPPHREPNLRFVDVPYALPEPRLARERDRLRADGADYLVASLHWGYEHEHHPRADQRACAERLWNLGFDGIVGHHPHIAQSLEGNGRRWVAFSLGDFVGGDRTIVSRLSYAVSLRFGGRDESPTLEMIPMAQSPFWAARHRTRLLREAPPFEQLVWDSVIRPTLAVAEQGVHA